MGLQPPYTHMHSLSHTHTNSNNATWHVHNALLIIRLILKYMLEYQSEAEAILQLDGSTTIPHIIPLEETTHTQTVSVGSKVAEGGQSQGPSMLNGSHEPTSPLSSLASVSESTLDSLVGNSAGGVRKGRDHSVEMVRKGGGVRGGIINPAEVAAMDVLLSRQLLEGLVCLLAEVPLL